jgi:methionyl-tRNA formyltransferase
MRTKISLLISGKLGFDLLIYLFDFTDIEFIATDKNSLEIIDFAKVKNVPLFIGNPRNGKLACFINELKGDLLLSINYLFLVEEDLIKKFKYPINFHGSLLPKYRGRTPHVWSIINNEVETGVTAHFIDSGCDTGDIILQKRIPILKNDTGFSVLEKYIEVYPLMVSEIIKLYKSNSIIRIKQNNSISTIYGKRTPSDGEINWNWQKERINNWVRAQAIPYPGAFTFFEGNKITIDKISFCDLGFDNEIPNGMILQVEPNLIVKTSNGAVKIEEIRNNEFEFIQNKILKNEN